MPMMQGAGVTDEGRTALQEFMKSDRPPGDDEHDAAGGRAGRSARAGAAEVRPPVTDTAHCAHCGAGLAAEIPTIERFGERFCSAHHAEQFVGAVRASRLAEVARREASPAACHLAIGGVVSWKDRLKRSACWAAPLLILLAIPLLWSGSAAAVAGGSAPSLLAALACPVAMFFMMRAMRRPQHRGERSDQATTPYNATREDGRG